MTVAKIVYYGQPKMYEDVEKGTVKMYISEYILPSSDLNWKEQYMEELKEIMEKYKGIRSIELFVPQTYHRR